MTQYESCPHEKNWLNPHEKNAKGVMNMSDWKPKKVTMSLGLPLETMQRLREYAKREDRSIANASQRLMLIGLNAEDKRSVANSSGPLTPDTATKEKRELSEEKRLKLEKFHRGEISAAEIFGDGDEGEGDDESGDIEGTGDEDDYDGGEDAAAAERAQIKREYDADQAKLAEGRYKDAVPEGSRSPIKFG